MANEMAVVKRDTVDMVANRVRELMQKRELHLPSNYSAENALKAAWLILQTTTTGEKDGKRPVLQACSKSSIANALFDMVVQGLNPMKKQCYFIAYGSHLTCQRSYFGDMALVQRVLPGADIYYGVVYEGDDFQYEIERGKKRIVKHHQDLANVSPQHIRAAYCVIEQNGRLIHTEIMTIDQIKRSWMQSRKYDPNGGETPHHTFTDQMALRTVIRRACKAVINASSDDYLLLEAVNRSDEAPDLEIEAEIAANANREVIDVEAVVSASPEPEPIQTTEEPPKAPSPKTEKTAKRMPEPEPEPSPEPEPQLFFGEGDEPF